VQLQKIKERMIWLTKTSWFHLKAKTNEILNICNTVANI